MSKTVRIGLGLVILGLVALFSIADLSVAYSSLWYFVNIASIIMMIVGIIMLWTVWGKKK